MVQPKGVGEKTTRDGVDQDLLDGFECFVTRKWMWSPQFPGPEDDLPVPATQSSVVSLSKWPWKELRKQDTAQWE